MRRTGIASFCLGVQQGGHRHAMGMPGFVRTEGAAGSPATAIDRMRRVMCFVEFELGLMGAVP
jgi:hypothetical protein